MKDFDKQLERYGNELKSARCPYSDAELDREIRSVVWNEKIAPNEPKTRRLRTKWLWPTAAAACLAAVLTPLNMPARTGSSIAHVDIDGERTRVRLIGINTPESVAEDESRNTEEGVIASDFVKELIDETGYEVWLEYDTEVYDQYGRTLAYVYIDYEGEVVMLERIILEEGLAEAVRYGNNDRYYQEFLELEADAS